MTATRLRSPIGKLTRSRRTFPPVPYGQILRDQGNITSVEELPQLVTNQAERGRADADDVLFGHHRPVKIGLPFRNVPFRLSRSTIS